MWPNLKPSQRAAVLAVVAPISASSAQASGWVDASKFNNLMALVSVGVLGSSATVDAKLQQATDSSGTGAKDISGKAITQLLHATPDDGKQCLINCKQEDLDVTNSFTFVKLIITPATAACLVSGAIIGFDPRYGPADKFAATTQAQVVG